MARIASVSNSRVKPVSSGAEMLRPAYCSASARASALRETGSEGSGGGDPARRARSLSKPFGVSWFIRLSRHRRMSRRQAGYRDECPKEHLNVRLKLNLG